MYILSMMSDDYEYQQPFAVARPLEPQHVTDLQAVVLAPRSDTLHATFPAYPRRTEPAAALFARVLPIFHSSLPFLADQEECSFQIHEGECVRSAELTETLDVAVKGDVIQVVWEDGFSKRTVEAPTRLVYIDMGNVLEHALRLAAWGVDDVPPLPKPLDEAVKVTQRNGVGLVSGESIPSYPRQVLQRRLRSAPTPRPGAFYAHDWVDFLTS